MAPPPAKKSFASKNLFAALSEEAEDPQLELDASTDGGVSLSREPTPRQELPAFTRASLGGFGDRLATARGARPQDVPPAPPRAAPIPNASTAISSVLPPPPPPPAPTASTGFAVGPSTLATASSFVNRSLGYKALYGSQPGSYTSPYDVGGKTPGDPRLPASSTTYEEFERKHGSGSRGAAHGPASSSNVTSNSNVTGGPSRGGSLTLGNVPAGQMPPVDTKGKGKAPASATAEQVTPDIPEGAEDRFLWMGPYIMVRQSCERQKELPTAQVLAKWFAQYMPEAHMRVVQRDLVLPSVVYAVEIPMTTEDFDRYHKLLTLFPDARDLNEQLDKGYHDLDQITAAHVNAAGEATWPQLTSEGETMEDRLAQLVQHWNLAVPWDTGRGPANRPDVWPVDMGGTLQGYPLKQ